MTPASLHMWQTHIAKTPSQAASLLGVNQATYFRWLAGTARIPAAVGLACNAIAHNLPAWAPKTKV